MNENDETVPLLSEATFDELVEEIMKRQPIMVLAYITAPGTDAEKFWGIKRGTNFAVVTLLETFADHYRSQITSAIDRACENEENEEDE